jgi:hypothetical protein
MNMIHYKVYSNFIICKFVIMKSLSETDTSYVSLKGKYNANPDHNYPLLRKFFKEHDKVRQSIIFNIDIEVGYTNCIHPEFGDGVLTMFGGIEPSDYTDVCKKFNVSKPPSEPLLPWTPDRDYYIFCKPVNTYFHYPCYSDGYVCYSCKLPRAELWLGREPCALTTIIKSKKTSDTPFLLDVTYFPEWSVFSDRAFDPSMKTKLPDTVTYQLSSEIYEMCPTIISTGCIPENLPDDYQVFFDPSNDWYYVCHQKNSIFKDCIRSSYKLKICENPPRFRTKIMYYRPW